MRNKITNALASIMLSSAMIIPMGTQISAETPTQTENINVDSFLNTYLSNVVVKDGTTTYELFHGVDISNYTRIIESESAYNALPDNDKQDVDQHLISTTGMSYIDLLNQAKAKQKEIEAQSQPETPSVSQQSSQTEPTETVPAASSQSAETSVQQQPAESAQPAQTTEQQSAATSQTIATAIQSDTSVQASDNASANQAQPDFSAQSGAVPAADPASITNTRMASTANGICVSATYTQDTFSGDVNMVVTDVAKSDRSYSVDIGFQKADGTELEPNAGKSVSIQITYPMLQGSGFEILHAGESLQVSNIDATSASFTATSFSVFTVQAKTETQSTVNKVKTEPTTTVSQENSKKEAGTEKQASSVLIAKKTTSGPKITETQTNKNQVVNVSTASPTVVSHDKSQAYSIMVSNAQAQEDKEDSITAQANAFVTTYLTSSTGVIYESANAINCQTILDSGNAWNRLSIDVRRKVNQILTSKIGKTYLKLLNEAKQVAGVTPRTSTETSVVSYSVMLGTSVLGILSVTKRKKEQL